MRIFDADVTGSLHVSGSSELKGNLIVSGSQTITGSLTVDGNTKFGDQLSDNHNFTGSVNISGSHTLTGSLNLLGNQFVSGSVYILNDLVVHGSSSVLYLTASQLAVSESYISVNVFEPLERFGGIKVYDSGSSTATASLTWDSEKNHWVYTNTVDTMYSGGMLISGPRNTGSLGDEVGTINNRVTKGQGGDHITSSNITDTGTIVSINSNSEITGSLIVTNGLSGSLDYTYLINVPTLVSGSSQISYSGLTGIPSNIISGSAQIYSLGFLTGYTETDTLSTVTARGASTSTPVTFNGNVTLGNAADLTFVDLAGTFPTSGKGFDWTLNNDGARIYAIQPSSDSIDFVFQLRDNASTNDRFVFHVDDYQGPAFDKYPLIIRGGTEFDLVNSALYINGTLVLSNGRVLQNISGNISMFTNDSGYLTAHPSVSAASSSDNSGRTYIQDILLDSFGHITGITTSTETVVDTNNFTTGATTNGTTGLITFTKNDGGTYTTSISGYVTTQITNLIDSSPSTLDTLNELAAALGDDPNFATTVATSIGNKVSKSGDTMTGNLSILKNNTTLTLGQINVSTGFTTIEMYAGDGGAFNGYSIRYNKDASFDQLEFIDGSGVPRIFFENGGIINATVIKKIGGLSTQFLKADGSVDTNTYLTAHPSVSAAGSSNNSGRTYIQDILLDGFGHITGITTASETVTDTNDFISDVNFDGTNLNFTGSGGAFSSLVDISSVNTDTNYYVTGATFNTGNGIITLTRNDGNTVTVDIDGRFQLSGSYLTGYTETDTLATVTARGNTTNQAITVSGVTSYNDVVISGGTLTVYESVSGATVFAVDGTNGRLFAVTDDLSNSLFSVNTISGLPVIEAFADYHIVMGRFNQNDFYLGTTGEIGMGLLPVSGYKLAVSGNVRATSFVKSGGTSSQFLKADGSVDTNTYLTSYLNYYTTGVTFNTGDGVLTFTRTDGGTYTVDLDGRYGSSSVDYYTTGATFNTGNGVITYTRNDGGTYTVDIDGRFLTSYSETSTLEDVVQRGNTTTISITAASFITQGGNSGQFVKGDGSLDSNTYLTAHPSVSAASSSNNGGRTYIQDILLDSFGHITGITTASETVTDTNYYVTGATFNTGDGVITLTRNDGNTITVDIDGRFLTAHPSVSAASSSDNSGRTYIQDILLDSFGHITGITTGTETVVDTNTNYYVTGATFNTGNGIITMTRNDGGTVTVDIDGKYSELGHTHDDRYLPYVKNVETSGLPAGRWHTIAVNTGSRAVGKFILRDTSSGNHQSVVFYATHHYGTYSDITVLINSRHGGNPFRYIRIQDGGTYEGALLQVYIDQGSSTVQAWMLENIQVSGWVIKDWVDEAVDPGDVPNFPAMTETPAQVDLDQTPQGGMIVTGPIYGGGDTTQYEYLNTNNYSTTTDTRYYTETEIANFFGGSVAITGYNKSNWDTAYGWGNHASQGYATTGYVQTQITNLIDAAPSALDTLNELAAALGDDANFSTTIASSIGAKLPLSGGTMTGNIAFGASSGLGLTWGLNTDAAFIKFISTSNAAGGSYLEIGTEDDSNEEIKFTQSGNVRFYLATDGYLKNGAGYKYLYENGTWGIDISGNAATVTNGVYSNGSYSNPSWITALAGSKITGNISGNAYNITQYTINQDLGTSNSPTFDVVKASRFEASQSSTRNKLSLWGTSDQYAIGMESAVVYGGLNDYAMTFQFNNDADRGFWWGHAGHTTAQGAMALTTNGYLTVARGVRVGYGESDTTTPNVPLQVYGSGSLVFDVQGSQGQLFSITDSLSGSLFSVNDISGLPILEVFSDDKLVAGSYGTNAFVVSGTTTTVSGSLAVSGSATVNGGTVWHSGNDGSGSGLDADTLDGYHASSFLTGHPSVSAAGSSNNSGRTYIQDILLDGFGHITGITTATETVTDTNDFISDVNFDGTNLTFTGSGGAFSSPVDISSVNTDTNYYVTGATFNTSTGVITMTRNDGGTVTVDIDGRFLTSYTETDTLASVTARGNTTTTHIGVTTSSPIDLSANGNLGTWIGGIQDATAGWSITNNGIGLKADNNTYAGMVLGGSNGLLYFGRTNASGVGTMSSWLEVNSSGTANFKLSRPQHNGSNLALVSEIPTNLNQLTNGPGYITAHPSVSAAGSSDNSGRTYIQDILLDSFGHITGITTATETVVDTDTNYYVTGATFNTSTGVITMTRNDGGTVTVDIDGKYQESGTYLGAITYNDNSNASYQLLWGSGNAVYGTAGVYLNPSTDYVYATSFNASDWFRSSGNTGWYNSTHGGGIYQTESTMVRTYDGRGFWIDGGNTNMVQDATLYVTATNNNDWLAYFNAYNGSKTEYGIYVNIAAGATYGYALRTDGSSFTYRVDGSGRVYAPIYYDINDTAYYLNPASTSNLGTVKLNSTTSGTEVFTVDGVNGRLFTITDDLSNSLFSVNTIAGVPVIEAFADNKVIMGRYNQNDFHLDTNGNIAMGALPVSGVKLFVSGKLSIGGSNSSYDLYNNGTSYFNGAVTVDDNLTITAGYALYGAYGTWTGEGNKIQWHSNNLYFQNTGGGEFIFRNSVGTNVVTITNAGALTAASLVKSGGTSAQFLMADGSVSTNPGWITSYTDTNNYTTGVTWNGTTAVLTFTRNNGDTYNVTMLESISDVTVTGGTYSAGTLTLTKSNGGTVTVSGFSVVSDTNTYVTGATFNTGNGVITMTRNDGNTVTVDIDGKYAEASHTHNYVTIDGVDRVGVLRFYGEGGDSGFSSGSYPYGIFQEEGVWGHPYPDLKINFHTGIVLAAAASYGGIRFQRDYNDTTELMSVGNGDAHVRVANNLYMGGNLVATQSWVGSQGYLTAHPSVSAAGSSNNSGRTYIQDILLDSFGHITGITTATETVVDTDTNYYVTGATFNTSTGVITMTRNDGGTVTVDIDGKYAESSHTHDDRYFTETESDARFQPLENQRLSTSNSPTFVDIYANEWFRNNNSNEGLYNTTTTQHWSSQTNGYWDASSTTSVSAIRFYTGGHVTSLRGHIYANSSNEIGFLNSAGNWGLRMDNSYNVQIYGALTVGSGTSSDIYMTDTDETTRRIHCNSGRIGFLNSSGSWSAWSDNTGNWRTDFAMYSPIYYDSNDTNYYLNPASTSNLKTVKVNSTVAGTEALTVDGVNGRLFTITDDMTDSIFSVNTISGLPVIEAFADYTVVMGRYGLNDLKIDNAGAVTIRGNTVWHAGNDGASSGLDADLLDGQHGSYYAAASSLGSYLPLGGGTMTGTITITNTDIRSNSTSNWTGDPGTQGKIQYHSARWYIVSDSGSDRIVQFRRNGTDVSYIDNSGNFIGNASTATALTSMNISQFTNDSGYITSYVDTDTNYYVTGATFNTSTGVITMTRNDGGTVTVDIDGKYAESSHTHDDRYFTETESDGRFQPLENQRLSTGNSPTFGQVFTTQIGINDSGIDCYMEVGDGNPTEDGISYGGTFNFYGDKSVGLSHLYFGGAYVTYNFVVGGRITENSSIRYKKDVETLEGGLDKVLAMRGVTYVKKDTGIKEVGLIAEELAEILPEVVGFDTQGQPDSVSYSRITAILIEAIKDLKKEIDELKGKK